MIIIIIIMLVSYKHNILVEKVVHTSLHINGCMSIMNVLTSINYN